MPITQDDLDNQNISQLHSAVIELSKSCFELKKLCATVLGSSIVMIAGFTHQSLDISLFIGSALLIVFFWIADSQSYYYQKKLRALMNGLQAAIKKRNLDAKFIDDVNDSNGPRQQPMTQMQLVFQAAFNWSMLFYAGLFILDIIGALLFAFGLIKTRA